MMAEIKIKEVSKTKIITTNYIGENLTPNFLVNFFGLKEPDVERYSITIYNI